MIRGLTLTQPWASLVSVGAKKIETRSWPTSFRGEIAIHAATRWTRREGAICLTSPFWEVLTEHGCITEDRRAHVSINVPTGAIVAVARLVDVVSTNRISLVPGRLYVRGEEGMFACGTYEREFGDYSTGRFAWLLANVRPLPEPIPCKGARGLWTVTGDVESQIREVLA